MNVVKFLLLLCFTVVKTKTETCVVADNCDFYNCLEANYECGSSGYPLDYGYHFCKVFADNQDNFNAKGQNWLINTRRCLQEKLLSTANAPAENQMNCSSLETFAFSTHPPCYTQTGSSICDIGPVNMAKVVALVGIPKTPQMLDYLQQFSTVGKTCGVTWYYEFLTALAVLSVELLPFF